MNPLRAALRRVKKNPFAERLRAGHAGAVLVGIRLGARSDVALDERTTRYYGGGPGSSRIDYAGDAHNLSGWFDWERALVDAEFPPAGRVFVVAAGGGREMLSLARAGYAVAGCECHPRLVDAGNQLLREQGAPGTIGLAPPGTAPAGEPVHDASIIGWSAYSLIRGRSARVALLRQVRALSRPGAPLLLSFFARDGAAYPFGTVARAANVVRRVRGLPRVETGDYLQSTYVHLFTRDTLAAELADGGWRLVRYGTRVTGHAIARAAGEDAA